ncbi:MAG: hypothetical protein KGJ88_03995 [Verrucomicrobiota bacterium]|nr:hypothetical protein [Verrucomicrobiota bacterium]
MRCRSDLRVCLNCVHYDARAAHQCRERRAEPVLEKDRGNFCEYFDFAVRVWTPAATRGGARENAARDQLSKLFGD